MATRHVLSPTCTVLVSEDHAVCWCDNWPELADLCIAGAPGLSRRFSASLYGHTTVYYRPPAPIPEPSAVWQVRDSHSGTIVRRAMTRSGARAAAERLDLAYGAYRYVAEPVGDPR
jgi:hypothetical protein